MRQKLLYSRNCGNRKIGQPSQMREKLNRTTEEGREKEVTYNNNNNKVHLSF